MKKSTLIIILAVILAGGFYFYSQTQKYSSKNSGDNSNAKSQNSENPEEVKEPENGGIESLIDAQRAVNYIAYNIADISPEKPVLGGSWHINRIWVVEEMAETQNILAYAEYEDGHIMRKVLAEISVKGGETAHKVEALFDPGEADWNLIQGEDIAFGKALLLFEKDDESGNWRKK